MKHVVLAAMMVTAPLAAHAARLDGNALQARCSTGDVKGCQIYLEGFNAALSEFPDNPGGRPACVPDGVTGSQMRDVVLKLLHEEPQNRERPAARLIMRAFAKAWPCHR